MKAELGLDLRAIPLPPITSAETRASALPPKKGWLYRMIRHPWIMPYNRLAILVGATNLTLFWFVLPAEPSPSIIMRYVVANFALAICIRMQQVINLLFSLATSVPKSWPLFIRWACGKVYHFGGIHVGAFFSGTLWFAYFISRLAADRRAEYRDALLALTSCHLAILIAICVVALPQIRTRHHDLFERLARFGSWSSLALFWIQAALTEGNRLFYDPSSLMLVPITFALALPWLRLRQVNVKYIRPSSHVTLAEFDYGNTPFAGSSTDLSRSPLIEWHSFANVPSPGRSGFRLTISRAGDWTGALIDDLPEKIWVKGIAAAGVGNIESCFKKVVWVATGSGIGPCLPHLFMGKVPSSLVWSTRNPERTYGKDLVAEIKRVQPAAILWDTDAHGKPDLVALAYAEYARIGAEAIICIANKKVTWHVVNEFESRGIPAFGAIWDS